jgi:hypothetical protein
MHIHDVIALDDDKATTTLCRLGYIASTLKLNYNHKLNRKRINLFGSFVTRIIKL